MTLTIPTVTRAIALGLLLPICLACASTPQQTTPTDDGAEALFSTTGLFGPLSFSPDGRRVLASMDLDGAYRPTVISVETSGPEPRTLPVPGDDTAWAVRFFPADDRVLYRSSPGGSELDHLFVREPDGTLVDLTARLVDEAALARGVATEPVGFDRDGRHLWLAVNDRRPDAVDLHRVDLTHGRGYRGHRVFENDGAFAYDALSADGTWVALGETRSTRDRSVHLLHLPSGTLSALESGAGPGRVASARGFAFSPDGRFLFGSSDADRETSYLVRWEVDRGPEPRPPQVVIEPPAGPLAAVTEVALSAAGSTLAVLWDRDAATELALYRLTDREAPTLEPVPLPPGGEPAERDSLAFSPDGGRLAFLASTDRTARNLYTVDVGDGGATPPVRHTDTLSPALEPGELVASRPLSFRAADGLEIPGLLYLPPAASADEPVPAVVWVHGGPGGQSRHGFNPLFQYLVRAGYAVYAVNHRGSGGYGKTFASLDDRRHGEADLDDCVAARAALETTGWIDPDRVAIAGASYGGYLVLAALAFRPEAFDAGVDFFGPSNWLRTLGSLRPERESIRRALETEMGSLDDLERLEDMSPLFSAHRITAPLLVLQGAHDRRVLPAESSEIVERLRSRGVPTELVLFEDEGHGFVRRDNRIAAYRSMRRFLDRHLKVSTPRDAAAR